VTVGMLFRNKRNPRRVRRVLFKVDCAEPIVPEDVRRQAAPAGVDVDELIAVLQGARDAGLGVVSAGREQGRDLIWPLPWWAETGERSRRGVAGHASLLGAVEALVSSMAETTGASRRAGLPTGPGADVRHVATIVDRKPGPWLPWPEWVAKFDAANRALDATRFAELDPGSAAALDGEPAGPESGPTAGDVDQADGESPRRVAVGLDEAAVALKGARGFAIEVSEDGDDAGRTYYVKPGGELARQRGWMDTMTSLVGFRRDADGVEVDVDLPAFYANPERAIGLRPVFAFAHGNRWTSSRSVIRVRPTTTEAGE
jgi:hypothetical protein